MKRTIVKRAAAIAVALGAGLIAGMAVAEPTAPGAPISPKVGISPKVAVQPRAELTRQAAQVQFSSQDFKINKRAPVAFKAFEMKDPKTGKAIAANQMVTLSNGKKMLASAYFQQLNDLERKFAAMGHTLHNGAGQRVVLQEAILPQTTLASQARTMTMAHAKFDTKSMRAIPAANLLQSGFTTAQRLDATRLRALGQVKPLGVAQTSRNLRTWNYMLGKQSLIAAFLDGKVETNGSKDGVKIYGEANAGGYLMNHRMALLQARGTMEGKKVGAGTASLNIYVMGQSVFNVNQSSTAAWNLSRSLSKTFDYSTSIRFTIGPIPVSGRLGTRGSAGASLVLGLRPAHATLQVIPNINAKVYAQVGVDIGIASAGVGGDLTLIKDRLTMGGEVGLDVDSKGLYISEHLYAHNDLQMLAGRIYLYARVNYLIGSKQWDLNLWNWSGFRVNGYLFNINKKTYVYQGGVLAVR